MADKPAKKLRPGDLLEFAGLRAELVDKGAEGEIELRFDKAGAELDEGLLDTLHVAGDRMLRLIDLLEGSHSAA